MVSFCCACGSARLSGLQGLFFGDGVPEFVGEVVFREVVVEVDFYVGDAVFGAAVSGGGEPLLPNAVD